MYEKAIIDRAGFCVNCAYNKGSACKALTGWFNHDKPCVGCTFFKTRAQVDDEKKKYPAVD